MRNPNYNKYILKDENRVYGVCEAPQLELAIVCLLRSPVFGMTEVGYDDDWGIFSLDIEGERVEGYSIQALPKLLMKQVMDQHFNTIKGKESCREKARHLRRKLRELIDNSVKYSGDPKKDSLYLSDSMFLIAYNKNKALVEFAKQKGLKIWHDKNNMVADRPAIGHPPSMFY